MAELPPRIIAREARLRSSVPEMAVSPSPQALASTRPSDDSNFPVLEAFHEYLNKERRKLRRRLWLTAGILGLAMAGVSLAVYVTTRNIVQDLRAQIGSMSESITSSRETADTGLSEQSARLEKNEKFSSALKVALVNEEKDRIQQSKSIQTEFAANTRAVEELNSVVKALKAENSALEGELTDLKRIIPGFSKSLSLLEGKINAVTFRSDTGQAPFRGSAATESFAPNVVSTLILPAGQTEPIRWHIIIPE